MIGGTSCVYVLQSGVTTATVNEEEAPTRDLLCGGPRMLEREHTHISVIHSTPCHPPTPDLTLGGWGLPRSRPGHWLMSSPTEVEVVPAGAALPLDPGPSDGEDDIGHRREPAGGGPEGWGC